MDLLYREATRVDRTKKKKNKINVRMARGVPGPNLQRDFKYWGTPDERSKFEDYRTLLADSHAFTLAEWILSYRPFLDLTE